MYRFTSNNTRRFHFDEAALVGADGAFAVDRLTQGVNHTAQQAFADGIDIHALTGDVFVTAWTDAGVGAICVETLVGGGTRIGRAALIDIVTDNTVSCVPSVTYASVN